MIFLVGQTSGMCAILCGEMQELHSVLPTFIQPKSHIFQKGIPMLLSAEQKDTFLLKRARFLSTLKVEGGMPPPPSNATSNATINMNRCCDWLLKTKKDNKTIELNVVLKNESQTLITIILKSRSQNVFKLGRSLLHNIIYARVAI